MKQFLEGVNQLLESVKEGYSDPLEGVLTYNNKMVCTTFFDGTKEITTEDIQTKETEIDHRLWQLAEIKNKIKEGTLSLNIKNIYNKSIEWLENKFKMIKASLRIEATKSGYTLEKDTKDVKSNEIGILQKTIYWERVSDTKEERDDIIWRLHDKFEKGKKKLTEEEKNTYTNFLKTMSSKYDYTKDNTAETNDEEGAWKEISQAIKDHKNNKVIPKEKIKQYSNDILNMYRTYFAKNNNIDVWDRSADFNSEKKSLYTSTKETLEIPENYEDISKEKLTKVVIGHEIEQHLFGRNNNNRLLGKWFASDGYDLISEWVAKINEAIAGWEINSLSDLEKLKEKPGLGIIGIFVCENYNYTESVEILRIFHKLGKRKEESECLKKATDMVKRRKRFFDYNEPGSSIKDSLYDRGKNRIIDYLTADKSLESAVQKYKDMNFWKLGKEELSLVPELKKELGINDNEVIYTLMISRILNDKLTKGIGGLKEYNNPLSSNSIDIATKRQLINILSDIKSLDSK